MVSEFLLNLWERKAEQGDEHSLMRLRELKEAQEIKTEVLEHIGNSIRTGQRRIRDKQGKTITFRISEQLLDDLDVYIQKTSDWAKKSDRSKVIVLSLEEFLVRRLTKLNIKPKSNGLPLDMSKITDRDIKLMETRED